MKGRFFRCSVIVVALILAGGAWAGAQASTVSIGFKFVVAGKTMEAGTYKVELAQNGNVVLTPENGTALEIPNTRKLNARSGRKAELVFDVIGSARFLAEVRLPGQGSFRVGLQGDAVEQQTVKGPEIAK